MEYRKLGHSALRVSAISFGAGPVSGLMVGKATERQNDTIAVATEHGVNWFDTAATYGNGISESCLGRALLTANCLDHVQIATKVRLQPQDLDDIPNAIRHSFELSRNRLGVNRVSLLQLHNSVTSRRGDLPSSICVSDVIGSNGVAAAFEQFRRQGLVQHFGFTGLGDRKSLTAIVDSKIFTAAQIPLNVLTPIAGQDSSAGSINVNYLELAEHCQAKGVGVIAIRVLAGGALSQQPASPHTRKTKFFTHELFQRDRARAHALQCAFEQQMSVSVASIRYVTGNLPVSTALIGFANAGQITEAVQAVAEGPLDDDTLTTLDSLNP